MKRALLLAAAIASASCASNGATARAPAAHGAASDDEPLHFSAPIARDHALVGVIWDVAAGRRVAWSAVGARMAGARHVLLGEKHDDPDHHALQARALRAIVAAGRRPAVALEMLEDTRQAAVDAYVGSHADARGLGAAVAWHQSGWPPWETYRPIADVAMAARLPIVAANLPRATVRAAMMDDAALPPAIAARLERPLPDDQAAALKDELVASHCGHLPEGMFDAMVLAQRARDAAMAERMRGAAKRTGGSVLIAGAGHVRDDRGVPAYLDEASVSVAFLEVQDGLLEPAAYAAGLHAARLPFDYVVFTPRANDDDPCAGFVHPPRGSAPRASGPPGPATAGAAPAGAAPAGADSVKP